MKARIRDQHSRWPTASPARHCTLLDAARENNEPEEGEPMNAKTCTAAANLKGEHIWCDEPAGHTGWAHGNAEHGLIWDGPNQFLTRDVALLDPKETEQ